MLTYNLTEMIRNGISVFIYYKRTFIFLTLTFTLLYLGINLLLALTPNASQSSCTSRTQLCTPIPVDPDQASVGHVWLSASNLPFLVDELMRINVSVRNELVELDQRRRDLLASVAAAQAQVEHVRSLLYEHSRQFMRLRATLHSYESALRDKKVQNSDTLHISWPLGRIVNDQHKLVSQVFVQTKICTLDSCLNWNPCPAISFLRVCRPHSDPEILSNSWTSELTQSVHFLRDCSNLPHQACLHVALSVTEALKCTTEIIQSNPTSCLVILTEPPQIDLLLVDSGSNPQHLFLLATPYFPETDHFRPGFDLFLPVPFHQLKHGFGLNESGPSPTLLPGTRPNLLGFSAGRFSPSSNSTFTDDFDAVLLRSLNQFTTLTEGNHRLFMYKTDLELSICWPSILRQVFTNHMFIESEWFPCHDAVQLLSQSTFGLVLHSKVSVPSNVPASLGWNVQLMLSLATGAIPVLVGSSLLPFEEAIPSELWSRAVLRIPRARVSELAAILESVPEHHRVEMRRQGQILYRRYFQGVRAQIDTLFLAISRRLGLPQPPAPSWTARPAFRTTFSPPKYYQVSAQSTYQTDLDDFLGPVGPTQSSPRFRANFTEPGGAAHLGLVAMDGGDRIIHPFWLYPSTPWDVPMPSDAAHSTDATTNRGLRPINHTINLAGFEFNMNLGGMFPYEQFTIVMLTYDRFEIACRTLEGLLNVPYVHSVVVVWNHPTAPQQDLAWPQLHVPIKVVHMSNNSLNNRFLPLAVIETDCILSMDDDIQLRHDEIVFGFRIWRENRDRLVGFPARAHFWNATMRGWYYNSDYTCEFSLVLTGASFFHKYYTYAYTYEMPLPIREMVDRYFNCEDLAMNFLISHLTRKPPIKATIHWSFTCPYCTTTLHDQPGHYTIRSKCLNELAAWYGYNPLLYSQYRADSLLFKTRIPSTKQKCYKFI